MQASDRDRETGDQNCQRINATEQAKSGGRIEEAEGAVGNAERNRDDGIDQHKKPEVIKLNKELLKDWL